MHKLKCVRQIYFTGLIFNQSCGKIHLHLKWFVISFELIEKVIAKHFVETSYSEKALYYKGRLQLLKMEVGFVSALYWIFEKPKDRYGYGYPTAVMNSKSGNTLQVAYITLDVSNIYL